MSRIPYTNTSDVAHYVGGVCIPAGGTRTIDASLLPPAAPVDAEPGEDPLLALASGKVSDIIAAIPGLSDADLVALIDVEHAGKGRKSLIEALELAKLERLDRAAFDAPEKVDSVTPSIDDAAAVAAAAAAGGEPAA